MNSISARKAMQPAAFGNEASIINRRELLPLLHKARQVLVHYDAAMDCSAALIDRSGKAVKTQDFKNQIRFCEFCKKHFKNSPEIRQGDEYPCEKIHLAALFESQRIEETYVYACQAGFSYWTSPLYRRGRYAGALIAGQVFLCGQKAGAAEKFSVLCKDKNAAAKIKKMFDGVPEKTCEEIQAMAKILGICAEEISEEGDDSDEKIRRIAWQRGGLKNQKEPVKTPAKKNRPAQAGSGEESNPEFFLENERLLLAAFRRGDNETGGRILKELMDSILAAIPGNLEIFRFRALELVVLLSRAAAASESSDVDSLLEANNRYLRRIQESKTAEELMENLHLIAERLAGKIFSFQGIRHASVLRRAERYIWENYTRKISLEKIAKASGLSAPYFSTIFKEEMGENLSSYLNRLRVEKASTLLTETGKPLNEIAGLCGFEDQSWFSKMFKNFTGVSPGRYRKYGGGAPRNRQ